MLHVWQSDDLYDPVPEKVAISDEPWGELGVVYPRLGKPTWEKSAVFLNIVEKAFDPPPPFRLNIMWWIFLKEF